MALAFEPSEIFQIAVRIEENGERFYREMEKRFDDQEVKELFGHLAREEVQHRKFYQKVLADLEPAEPFERYEGEYFDQLRSYAGDVIFSQKAFEEALGAISDVGEALDFAIAAERNSIFYYQEIKRMVSEKKHAAIDEIVDEERRHFAKLHSMRMERA